MGSVKLCKASCSSTTGDQVFMTYLHLDVYDPFVLLGMMYGVTLVTTHRVAVPCVVSVRLESKILVGGATLSQIPILQVLPKFLIFSVGGKSFDFKNRNSEKVNSCGMCTAKPQISSSCCQNGENWFRKCSIFKLGARTNAS